MMIMMTILVHVAAGARARVPMYYSVLPCARSSVEVTSSHATVP